MDEFIWATACVSDGRWRLVVNTATGEETALYDLAEDPYEKVNQLPGAEAGEAAKVSAVLQAKMKDWQQECKALGAKYPLVPAPTPYFLEANPRWLDSLTPNQKERMEKLKSLGYL